jgi:long-chain acyl-CoA synthetase
MRGLRHTQLRRDMEAPWLVHYDPGVPASIGEYPDKTLVDFVAEHAATKPDATAIVFKGRRITFRELEDASNALVRGLSDLGVSAGDRVALVLPNCPQFIIAELAIWKLGGIIAPQNPLYSERELEESFATSTPCLAIVLSAFYEKVKHVQPRTSIRRVVTTSIKDYLPRPLRVLFTMFKEKKEGHRAVLRDGDLRLRHLMKSEAEAEIRKPNAADAAILLMSGGTTGRPKAVVSAHSSLVMSGLQIGSWLRDAISGPGASMMLPLPLFHTYGCAGAQSLTITEGIPLILVPNPRDIKDVVRTIDKAKPALFCAVPTLFSALLEHPLVKRGKADFSSIRGCFSGASALMAETKKRFEELTGGRIVEGYSLTEATMALVGNPLRGLNKIGSVGVPLPDVSLRIVDADDASRVLPPHEVGEIVLKAPQLMRGYWNAADEATDMLRDGWLYTGDLGYVDHDSYLFIVDRKKDLIKTSGFQVWPREIEEVIAAHPAVGEVGVAGVKHERKGEAIVAWIVLRQGHRATADELRAWCRERLAPYKVPSRFEFRDDLPKTLIGKVLRRVLAAEELAS